MQLIVHELLSTLEQTVTCHRDTVCKHIRPYLYKHLNASGSVKVQVLDANGQLCAESNSINIVDISASNYYHGFIRFDIDFMLKKNFNYIIRLVGTGYSFTESNYIGWVANHENKVYSEDYVLSNGAGSSLTLQVWEKV
jgi:hypothetical protein